MDSQKFCLKWDGFQSSVTSVFDVLRVDCELVDVTLCCDGQRVRAHRMMLSACSPYFRELFKDLPNQHLAVFLKDTSAVDLNAIVEFMYKGSVNVAQSQLASFIKTAEMLQVRGLSGDDEKASPPSRHSSGHRQTAPPSRQMTPSSPLPRRPPEPALHPPPPPPPLPPPPLPLASSQQSQHGQHSQGQQGQKQEPSSPPAKRRRASEPNALSDQPLSSPSVAGGGGGSGSSGSTASSASATTSAAAGAGAVSPRPASLPSAATTAATDGALPSPDDAYNHQHQQHQQQQHQQHDNYHHEHDEDSNRLSHEESAYGDEISDNHDDSSMPLGGVKMEKMEPVDDDVVLDDTLDHVAELERYAAEDRTTAAAARGYMQHLQTRQRLSSMSAAAAAAAAVQMGAMQAGPSQRLSEDGNSQGGGAARFACSVCGQCYTNPDSRQMHMKKHSGETTCPVCGKVYSMVHNLRRHMRTAHDMHRGGAMQGHMLS